jgi:MoaA/NifB/PqqE/SkfB family radical SAM enzyme
MTNLRYKLALLRGLLSGDIARVGPAWVTLDLTRRCNYVCLGCFFHCVQPRQLSPGDHQITDLPLPLVESLAADLVRIGTPEVLLSAEGEPLLHPRFFDIVDCLRRARITLRVFTNGSLIDEPMARQIVGSGLDTLNVTFWAVNRAEHAEWHPGVNPEYLDRRKRGVKLLAQIKRESKRNAPSVNLQMPLNRLNFANIGERVDLALESGCNTVTFAFFRDWGGQFESHCLLPEDGVAVREEFQAAKRRLEAGGIKHNVDQYLARVELGAAAWRKVPCYAGWFQSYVKVDGTVMPCCPCSLVMGNLRERSFSEIWNGTGYREFRRRSADPRGLEALQQSCNCANCCLLQDSVRVHRVFRWLSPIARRAYAGEAA